MTGRRRGIRLHRGPFETAWWFLTSRLAITVAAVAAVVVLVAVLALTRPWQALTEERIVFVPVPVVVTDDPDSEQPASSNGDGPAPPRSTPAPDRVAERR